MTASRRLDFLISKAQKRFEQTHIFEVVAETKIRRAGLVSRGCPHCDQCGICRLGTKESLSHCQLCKMCYPVTMKDNHRCLANKFDKELIIKEATSPAKGRNRSRANISGSDDHSNTTPVGDRGRCCIGGWSSRFRRHGVGSERGRGGLCRWLWFRFSDRFSGLLLPALSLPVLPDAALLSGAGTLSGAGRLRSLGKLSITGRLWPGGKLSATRRLRPDRKLSATRRLCSPRKSSTN